jgi:hypothetical protein
VVVQRDLDRLRRRVGAGSSDAAQVLAVGTYEPDVPRVTSGRRRGYRQRVERARASRCLDAEALTAR